MDANIANQIAVEMRDILGRLDGSIRLVMENCDDEEFKSYRTTIGRIMGALVLDVLNPIYEENPELDPDREQGAG